MADEMTDQAQGQSAQAPTQQDLWASATEEASRVAAQAPEEPEVAQEQVQQAPPSEFDIPGIGKATIEQIRAWKEAEARVKSFQADYTRKTQAVAQRERQLAQQAQQLYAYAQQIAQRQQQAQQQPVPPQAGDEDDPYMQQIRQIREREIAELRQEITTLKSAYQEQETQQHMAQIEGQIQSLQQEFPFMQPEVVLAWMGTRPELDIRAAAQASHELNVDRYRKWQETGVAPPQQQQQQRAPVMLPPRGSPGAGAGAIPIMPQRAPNTWQDATQQAMELARRADRS